jgi:hypothetical protein
LTRKVKNVVKVYNRTRGGTHGYTVMRSECCNSVLVTLGKIENGLVRCFKCGETWSLERLGLKLVDGEYQFDNR